MSKEYLDGVIDTAMFVLKLRRTNQEDLEAIIQKTEALLQEALMERQRHFLLGEEILRIKKPIITQSL